MAQLGAVPSTQTLLGPCGVFRTTFVANGTSLVNVADTNFSIGDMVNISLNTVGGTVGALPVLKTITLGTGFAIAATAADTSIYNVLVIRSTP